MHIDISIVAPVYNEEHNLLEFYSALNRSIPPSYTWELWLIDDESTDSSPKKIKELCTEHLNVKSIFLSKNFGHQIALTAGLDHVKGRAVITMDSDLPHPPESIPTMLDKWKNGAQVVFAVRDNSKNLSWFKRTTSSCFYKLLKMISHLDLINGAADFQLLDQKVVKYLNQYHERDRFLRGIISDIGFRQEVILYSENPRHAGTSKYNLFKMMRLAITGIISFSSFPLRICSITGFFIASLSILYAGAIIYDKLINNAPTGIPSILVGVFFIGGIQLIFIGILGEYLMTIFKEVKQRPLYCIDQTINVN